MDVFIKLGHIVKVFHGEDVAELVIENVSLGLTSTMGEPVLLERGYASCITPLAFDQMPVFLSCLQQLFFINSIISISLLHVGPVAQIHYQ